MKDTGKYPILANGQYYIEPLVKKTGGGPLIFRMNMQRLKKDYVEILKEYRNLLRMEMRFLCRARWYVYD